MLFPEILDPKYFNEDMFEVFAYLHRVHIPENYETTSENTKSATMGHSLINTEALNSKSRKNNYTINRLTRLNLMAQSNNRENLHLCFPIQNLKLDNLPEHEFLSGDAYIATCEEYESSIMIESLMKKMGKELWLPEHTTNTRKKKRDKQIEKILIEEMTNLENQESDVGYLKCGFTDSNHNIILRLEKEWLRKHYSFRAIQRTRFVVGRIVDYYDSNELDFGNLAFKNSFYIIEEILQKSLFSNVLLGDLKTHIKDTTLIIEPMIID